MKVAVLVPCHKRPEYTAKCLRSLEDAQEYKDTIFHLVDDGSNDNTTTLLNDISLPKKIIWNQTAVGLRNVIINFFETTGDCQILSKVDNDCTVPKNWLNDLVYVIEKEGFDIVSPNVYPSNAAYKYGKEYKDDIRTTSVIGGVWTMKRSMVDDIWFEKINTYGIDGAIQILKRITLEKDPKMAWISNTTFQDIGHWSGSHPEHLKIPEHEEYSARIRRDITWSASDVG